MNKAYRALMEQQRLSEEEKQRIYRNLQKLDLRKPRKVMLKVATVAACIVLLIPMSILAAQSILGIANFNRVEQATIHNMPGVGYEISFDTITCHPITVFSKQLQSLKETIVVSHDTWENAQADLGVDLISNSICTDSETKQISSYISEEDTQTSHCESVYHVADDQLYFAKISAVYQRSQVKFRVSAKITAGHPNMEDEELVRYHGFEYLYFEKDDPEFIVEQYTTQNGIPMTIAIVNVMVNGVGYTDYSAYFAVNNISYQVSIVGCEGAWKDSHIYAVFNEILEGFYF